MTILSQTQEKNPMLKTALEYPGRVWRYFDPAHSLLQRLQLGGAADEELYLRVERCSEFFDENPLERLRWRPRLRKAAQVPALVGGMDFWPIIEPILRGDTPAPVQRTPLHPHALPVVDAPKAPAPPDPSSEKTRAGTTRLGAEFSSWVESLNGGWERLRELAPCIADEVLALSARADSANSIDAACYLYGQARNLVTAALALEASRP